MIASEAHPFAKTGGLAEVLGALPAALVRLGLDVTVILPRYRGVSVQGASVVPHTIALGGAEVRAGFVETTGKDGVKAVLVDVPELFDRESLYGAGGRDYPDNAWRFAVLSRAALEYVRLKGIRPSVFHAHDWQAGLVPVFQKMHYAGDPVVGGVPSVFTIHNLAFQGVFPPHVLRALGLGPQMLDVEAMEFWGQVNFLKGGINFSEKLTTVSPTYAREILTPAYGFGLDGALRRRARDLSGILNGIDTDRWNPAADPLIPARYSAEDLSGKREAKRGLLDHLGMDDPAALDRPLIGLISRLTDQKGFDLIGAAAGDLMSLNAGWAMLGSGEPHYEGMWRALAARYPGSVSSTIGFDERLAHMIEAGADIFLMPSRYEPCGLNQLYSLRYGTVPVVRATGGLDDTVIDASQPGGNGFKFSDYEPGSLVAAVATAIARYQDPADWQALQRAGMARDSSWDVSAREYVKVYEDVSNGQIGNQAIGNGQ
jgi:starch synthase